MKKYLFLLAAMLAIGCSNDEEVECTKVVHDPEVLDYGQGVFPITYNGVKLHVQDGGDHYLYQGDIMLFKEESKSGTKAVGISATSKLWENNIIYYDIDPALTGLNRVYDAIAHWERYTNIKFVKRTVEEGYVYFTVGTNCSATLGYTGRKQYIRLASNCSTGNTIHEIGHTSGLFHEQSRVDRDNDIIVHYDNIQSNMIYNFDKVDPYSSYAPVSLTDGLDFGSVMMYGSFSFSMNGKATITKLDGSTFTVQRAGLSKLDRVGLESIYPAPEVDTDGDGLLDKDDNCPNTVGPVENNGCPWEDTDGDKVLDKDDNCPAEFGPVDNKGCPYPDKDGDGIIDKDDICPDLEGVDYNYGCPLEPSPTTHENCGEII